MNALELRRRTLGKGVYKKTVEGNPAIAQGSLARRYPGIGMQGWTEQAQYEGKNLLSINIGQIKTGSSNENNYASFETDGVHVHFEPGYGDLYFFGAADALSEESYEEIPQITSGVYYISNNCNTIQFYFTVWRNNKTMVLGFAENNNTRIVVEDGDKFRIFLRCNTDTAIDKTINLMIVKDGDDTTIYEPYTGGAPSPSPDYPQEIKNAGNYNEETGKYEYGVKLTGANLFDTRRIRNLNSGTNVPDEYHINGNEIVARKSGGTVNQMVLEIGLSLKPGTYYFAYDSMEITNQNGETYSINSFITSSIRETASGDVVVRISLTTPGNYTKVTIENDIDMYLSLSAIHEWESISELKIYGLRIVLNADTPFEPYKEQTVTLTADRPLTKWDKLEKRNGQWGWVYKSAEIVLDGSEDWVLAQTDNYNQFYININDTIEHSNSTKNVYCEKFRSALIADRETEKEIIYTVLVLGNFGGIAVSTDLATEVDAWKTWLQSNAIRALYKSTEETFVPLSESEQEQMNELYTFRPTTVLSNDCDCNMTLTYKTKKSLEVTD